MEYRVFPATDGALDDINEWIETMLEEADCSPRSSMQVQLCLEEVFVNIAHYAYGDATGEAEVWAGVENGKLTMTFADRGLPFDPLAHEDPDVAHIEQKETEGGLGIYLVKQMMDEVTYRYEEGKNILTMVKIL